MASLNTSNLSPNSRSPASTSSNLNVTTHIRANGLSHTTAALSTLKDVAEAINTVPCVKYVAQIVVTVIKVIDEVHSNKEAFQSLGERAQEVVLAIANACGDNGEADASVQLQEDLRYLTNTLEEMMHFVESVASRSKYKRFLYKAEDAENIKLLDVKLNQAFQLFLTKSSMSIRLSQRTMALHIKEIYAQNVTSPLQTPPLLIGCPLQIPDGIYLIRNASTGRVIELENGMKCYNKGVSVYTAPSHGGLVQSQLWSITSIPRREHCYSIRNVAAGIVLDVTMHSATDGMQMICHTWHGRANQIWEIFGSQTADGIDYCTIRCYDPPIVLDSACPLDPSCQCLHTSSLNAKSSTQEWTLTRFSIPYPLPAALPPSGSLQSQRRTYYLQNVRSGYYATQLDRSNGSNIRAQPHPSTAWYFTYVHDHSAHEPSFAIISTSYQTTLDHCGGTYINSSRYDPWNPCHMWQPIPRDNSFVLQNHYTGELLCHDERDVITTVESTASWGPACHWKLEDTSGETRTDYAVIYDSTLSFPPLSLLGAPADNLTPILLADDSRAVTPDQRQLRVILAAETLQMNFSQSLDQEHEMLLELLRSGYVTFVMAPQIISACGKGKKLRKVIDAPSVSDTSNYSTSGRAVICE